MRRLRVACVSLAMALAVVFGLRHQPVRASEPITEEDLFRWVTELSNWGRWGPDDELGAANLITPRKRERATRLVRSGISVGLAHPPLTVPFDPTEPLIPAFPSIAPKPTVELDPDNPNPFFHWMNRPAMPPIPPPTSDRYNVSYHGAAHSHMDALCHLPLPASTVPRIFPERLLYNGVSLDENNGVEGCVKQGINALQNGIVTKGVLFDATLLPHLLENGSPWLAPGTRVTRADLEALERIERVRVEPGDVILLYTGRWKRRAALGPWPTSAGVAGYYADTLPYIREKDVAFIGHDEWNDVFPGGFPGYATLPIHSIVIPVMGVDIFDNLDLEALAETAKRLRRYAFLFTAAPVPVVGGTGSPLNPVATF